MGAKTLLESEVDRLEEVYVTCEEYPPLVEGMKRIVATIRAARTAVQVLNRIVADQQEVMKGCTRCSETHDRDYLGLEVDDD